ncbi:MAG TPA: NAD(P)/FAD-dependent oxidoreductase [Casimicrobiaceae bacterium]|nr:NAD(P)/FAD-dependent oxidoreductase [Casimicrobiaceae bacterium]
MSLSAAAPDAHRIVIVGGGAGGLPLATGLGNRYGRGRAVEVTLVDQNATHVWKPLLHEVAAGRMDADAHALDYLAIAYWHRFRFRQGSLRALDRARKEIALDAVVGPEGEEVLPKRTLRYDTLILCLGSVSNDFGVPGASEHPISLDTLADAERFHRRLLAECVRADGRAGAGGAAVVDIVIIGAGATGVELAAEIRQTTRALAAYGLDNLDPSRDIRITILEGYARILPALSEHVANAATELLAKLRVDVRTGQRVTEIDADGVHTASGEFFHANLTVWAAGIMAPAVLRELDGLEVNRANQLVVGPTLQTTRDPSIFAFGDCAAAPWLGHKSAPTLASLAAPRGGGSVPRGGASELKEGAILPPRAQVAHQQATLLVKSIKARLAGKPMPAFRFRDFGSLVSLGELSAVGTLMGRLIGGSLLIQGLIARLMYTSLYKLHQVSIHGLVRVAFDTVGRFLRERLEPRVKLH